MKRRHAGLLFSAAAHAMLAGAILAAAGTNRPATPASPPAVELVAIAPPMPMPMPMPPAPPAPAAPSRVDAALATALAGPAADPVPPPPAPDPVSSPPLPPRVMPPRPLPRRRLALAAARPAVPPATPRVAPRAPAFAAPAPSGPPAPAAPPADWLRAIAAWLAAHRAYPGQARREGEQGTVVLRLVIARDGTVRDATLLAGSGHADLDRASLAAVRGAHLPPAPSPDAPAELTLRVPIRYALETSD